MTSRRHKLLGAALVYCSDNINVTSLSTCLVFAVYLRWTALTRNVNCPGDEAVLSELPGLSDVYNYRFSPSQELLQLVVAHICARRCWAEPAEQQRWSCKHDEEHNVTQARFTTWWCVMSHWISICTGNTLNKFIQHKHKIHLYKGADFCQGWTPSFVSPGPRTQAGGFCYITSRWASNIVWEP